MIASAATLVVAVGTPATVNVAAGLKPLPRTVMIEPGDALAGDTLETEGVGAGTRSSTTAFVSATALGFVGSSRITPWNVIAVTNGKPSGILATAGAGPLHYDTFDGTQPWQLQGWVAAVQRLQEKL